MSINKFISYIFRFVLILTIIINYIFFINYSWLPLTVHYKSVWVIIFLFHFLLIMTIWSLIVTSTSEPGQVPLYWGFYLGDSDSKRRRYCLMCNVFKPDRCHHCSVCNKCVLNMDHHCPWIDNCIGFFNRKYFVQMLFYFNVIVIFILVLNGKFVFDRVMKIVNNRVNLRSELTQNLGYIFIYVFDIALQIIIALFFKFHLNLILENKTTIETIDKKGENFDSSFDLGFYNNWIQVMGTNKLLWFLPLKLYMGIPKGNGIDWHDLLLDDKQNDNKSNLSASMYASNYISNDKNSQNDKNDKIAINPTYSLGSLYKNSNINIELSNPKINQIEKNNQNLNLNEPPTSNSTTARHKHTSSIAELIPNMSRSVSPVPNVNNENIGIME